MKLYVWHDSLTDYTSGVMFALANSVDEAREAIIAEAGQSKTIVRELSVEPTVYEGTAGFAVWGGGQSRPVFNPNTIGKYSMKAKLVYWGEGEYVVTAT